MRVRGLFVFLIVVGAMVAVGQPTSGPPTTGPAVEFRSGTRIVEITLSATTPPKPFALRDLIHPPVIDLEARDLRVFDNGVEQAIASFEKIGGAVRARNGVSIAGDDSGARPARASIIVLFDGLDTDIRDQFMGHDGIAKMLDRFPPETRIALLGMDEDFRVLQDFSYDRGALRAAIYKYERDYPLSAYGTGTELFGMPFPMMDGMTRIAKSVDALKQLARLAGNVRGRKNVLWVSGGFPLAKFHGEVIKGVRELVAANVALYPVNPQGLLPVNTDDLRELAALTGGKAFYGSNDVTDMAEAAVKSLADGYVLSFVPSSYREDGSFHELRVETSRRNVEVHYRMGYVADPSK
jgi:VWFA-related protein